jgi:hypothetical protein
VSRVTSANLSFNHPTQDLAHFPDISDLQVECSGVFQLLSRCGGKVCLVDASEESGLSFDKPFVFYFSYVAKSRDDIVFWGEIFGQKGGKEVFIIFRILSGCRPVSA